MFEKKEKNLDNVESENKAEENAVEEIKETAEEPTTDAASEESALPTETAEEPKEYKENKDVAPIAAPQAEQPISNGNPEPVSGTNTAYQTPDVKAPSYQAPQSAQLYGNAAPYGAYRQGGFVYPPTSQPQQAPQTNYGQPNGAPQSYQQNYYGAYPNTSNMPYPQGGQPMPQNMPYPQGNQPYQQNMPYSQNPQAYQNYQNYPPMYPQMPPQPPVKKKMKGGTKFFIFVLVFLFLFGGGVFTYSLISERNHFEVTDKNEASSEVVPSVTPAPSPDENSEDSSKSSENSESSEDGGKNAESSEDSESSESSESSEPNIEVKPYTDGITINKKPSSAELDAQEVYEKVLPSTVTIYSKITTTSGESESYATGIFVTEDGYIVTNSHVVNNTKSTSVTVTTSDGQEHECVIVGFDKTTDLAILKIDGSGYTPAEFGDASELTIGEWVIAIGNPGGTSFTGSLTRGVISGLDRTVGSYSSNGMTYIQTDAAINPGNSGGPLVNMYGQVVGINSSKIVADYYEGMGFAIPVSKAKDIIDQLLSTGYVSGRVRLGITGMNYQDLTLQGVEIVSITEGSGFEGTDAKEGDVITAVDGNEVTSLTSLANELLSYSPGDTCEITIVHPANGKEYTVTITLLADEGETQK